MKKCIRCLIVIHSDDYIYCPSCDGALSVALMSDILTVPPKTFFKSDATKIEHVLAQQKAVYLVGSYFQSETFLFSYIFYRQLMKYGKSFKQWLIQPIDPSYVIRIPWIAVNLVDSFCMHVFYKGYCEKCHWKYNKALRELPHTQEDCDYQREYFVIVDSIANGKIPQDRTEFETAALEKLKAGKRSAFHDLATRNINVDKTIDVILMCLSVAIVIYVVICLFSPLLGMISDL